MQPRPVATPLPGFDGLTIKHALTPQECREWIATAEQAGYVRNGQDGQMFAGNRQRATVHSAALADRLWERIKPFLPEREHDDAAYKYDFNGPKRRIPSGTYVPVGVSDFVRFSKYSPGGHFTCHKDTTYVRGEEHAGLMTILVSATRAARR